MVTQTGMRSLILLSGGLDSAAALCLDRSIEVALFFDYGQRPHLREKLASENLANQFGVRHIILQLPWFSEFGLTRYEVPSLMATALDDGAATRKSADAVWVPNRNGAFIEIAAGIAEAMHIQRVIVGFNREEAQTFPDNSEDYLRAINTALCYSTRQAVEVVSPTAHWTKEQIVNHLKSIGFQWKLLWSCYDAKDTMCGWCESCQRLKRALALNEIESHALFIDKNN